MKYDDDQIWLCLIYTGYGGYDISAVYDNASQAEAWLNGVEANFGQGCLVSIKPNEGPIDIRGRIKEMGNR